MPETIKGPPHPQLAASIQGLSSNAAQDSNSRGKIVVRDLIGTLGEDAISAVGGITSDASETSRKEPLARVGISAGHRGASGAITIGILKPVEPSVPFLRAMLKLGRHSRGTDKLFYSVNVCFGDFTSCLRQGANLLPFSANFAA